MIWRARNNLVHLDDAPVPWQILRAQFRDALLSMRQQGRMLPHPDKIRNGNRHFMQKIIEKAADLGSSIVSYMADENDAPLSEAEQRELLERSAASNLAARRDRAILTQRSQRANRRTQTRISSVHTGNGSGSARRSVNSPASRRGRIGYARTRSRTLLEDSGRAPEPHDPNSSESDDSG